MLQYEVFVLPYYGLRGGLTLCLLYFTSAQHSTISLPRTLAAQPLAVARTLPTHSCRQRNAGRGSVEAERHLPCSKDSHPGRRSWRPLPAEFENFQGLDRWTTGRSSEDAPNNRTAIS